MPNTGSLQAIAVPLRASGKRIMNRPRLLVINIYSLALVAGLATFAFTLTVDWMLRVFIADLVETLGPLAMIVLFVVISIPMIETKLLAEKPAYAHYQKNTPMLLPKLTQR